MPCEPIIEKGKVTGWICSRSRGKPKPPPCYKCGKPSTKLCDFRDCGAYHGKDDYGRKTTSEWASINTCDRPMCDECANHVGEDIDYCDEHFNEFSMIKAERAERIHKERLQRLGISEEGDDNV